ncbi:tRNA (adenosine(37)-N6)-threonylcarbamoyltransferase complex ATPase subunit type 1 TsaE [Candidatus Peregrinibacteria bacterium CG11_big_fil_rev_8_21_14_0_20_46_8]|nr:MAG: tRNA (adenosine(37)-N6)-threonylcarbamoyltransferase complex ATPase subunit type 1 TsaE [Candidatus Peregrinibacteria bacterium CG11_big_fil_rev_8_21_14_0_20_46_8]
MNKKTVISRSVEDTHELAREVVARQKTGIICLFGDLGAGKTTFVQGLAKALGIADEPQSPTFAYQRIYDGMYHYDFYRLSGPDYGFLEDILHACTEVLVVIEWPERMLKYLPNERIEIMIEYIDEHSRKFILNT